MTCNPERATKNNEIFIGTYDPFSMSIHIVT